MRLDDAIEETGLYAKCGTLATTQDERFWRFINGWLQELKSKRNLMEYLVGQLNEHDGSLHSGVVKMLNDIVAIDYDAWMNKENDNDDDKI